MTWAAARNSAPSSRYKTARDPMTPMSEMALEIGWDCTITLKPQMTAIAAKMRKRITSMSGEESHQQSGDQEVEDGHGEHEFPREGHQLIVAEARQRAANPDEDEQERAGFGGKPEERQERVLRRGNEEESGQQEEDHGNHREGDAIHFAGGV